MGPPELDITERASSMLHDALDTGKEADHAVRVEAHKLGIRRFRYSLDIVSADDHRDGDLEVVLENGVKLWTAPDSAALLSGCSIDFVDQGGLQGAGFKFTNPNEHATFDDPLENKLQGILDAEINPSIASHGGIIELIEVKDNVAYVHMGGGCQGCGSAAATLRQGVEQRLKELVPEITALVDVTDHDAGENPYFPSAG